jgi:hypothetical protein
MEGFEIKDIVSQDNHGIVYRAIDQESGNTVAILRFFPFGQNHGGLNKEETTAHTTASKRLTEIDHYALRSVIAGGVDPIDHIPFLVSQWVEGASLRSVLDGEPLDPRLVIDIMRLALEVSTVASHVLNEEAVWVETDIDSIIVGTNDSGRGFTFLISPFKWLGTNPRSKKLSSLVDLAEDLSGWRKKLYSDHSGSGLGGWLKWLKKNPDVGLHEALEFLASSTGNDPPQPEEKIVQQAVVPSVQKHASRNSSKSTLLVSALAVFMVLCGVLFVLPRNANSPRVVAENNDPKISDLIADIPRSQRTRAPVSEKLQADKVLKITQKPNETTTGDPTAKPQKEPKEPVYKELFSPNETERFSTLKHGNRVKVQGTLANVAFSKSGKSMYFYFSDPYKQGQIRGFIRQKDYRGTYTLKAFNGMIGKEVTILGNAVTEFSEIPTAVKAWERAHFTVKK